jgi:hypothetical protein
MGGGKAGRIERLVDRLAAGTFAAAVAFSALRLGMFSGQLSGLFPLGAAALAYLGCGLLLRAVRPEEPRFDVGHFELGELAQGGLDELLLTEQVELLLTEQVELLLSEQVELTLTDADRFQPTKLHAPDELVLDDILAELGPDSRVVRLFDRAAMPTQMPTPGQLNARIERHLGEGSSPTATPDASQALYSALAELRRSLRS